MPILIATGAFCCVLGVLFFYAGGIADSRQPAEPRAAATETETAARRPAEAIEPSRSANAVAKQPVAAAESEIVDLDVHDGPQIDSPTRSALDTVRQPIELDAREVRLARVKAQLAAGEFGPALEAAGTVQDVAERSELLKLIAEAQMQAGEFDGALAAIRRIPIPARRRQARGQRAAKQVLAGGSGADFEQLKQLIQEETSGPWEEEEGEGGTMTEFETGIRVDPNGMLHRLTREERTKRLDLLGIRARKADLNDDMARASSLRLVSLTRLEQAAARRIADGLPVVETMKHLAGLWEVRYVFVYPEEGEIVIGGPAEGWRYSDSGQPVGVEGGRPTLQLDDLVTVTRTFSVDGLGMFNCLIVPRQEGLKRLTEYVARSNARGPLRPSQVRNWVRQLQKRLGLQDVEVNGVPADSRVAQVIVEADYRMKLIGIGKLDGGEGIPNFFDLLSTAQQQKPSSMDALRWWLTMQYDAVLHSPDHNVFEIRGSSVLCRSENEFITDQGQRVHTGKAEATNRLFAQNFTKHYAKLAERDPVFADLQNIFDLALVAALIRHERLDDRIGWDLGVFASGGAYRPAQYAPAKTVMSVVNHRVYNGKDIVVQVAGGVRADLMAVVTNQNVVREAPPLEDLAGRGRAPQLPEGRWWWDAAN